MASSCCVQITHSFANRICCDDTDPPLGEVTFTLVSPSGNTLWDPDAGTAGKTFIVGDSYVATLGEDADGAPLADLGAFESCPLPVVDGYFLGPTGDPASGDDLPYYRVDVNITGAPKFTWYMAPLSSTVTCDTVEDLADHLIPSPTTGGGPNICDILDAADCSGGGGDDFDLGDHSISELSDGPTDTPAAFQTLVWNGTRLQYENFPGSSATPDTIEFGQDGAAQPWLPGQDFDVFCLLQEFTISAIRVISGEAGDLSWPWIIGFLPDAGDTTGALTTVLAGGTGIGSSGPPTPTTLYGATGTITTGGGGIGLVLAPHNYVFRFTSLVGASDIRPRNTNVALLGQYT